MLQSHDYKFYDLSIPIEFFELSDYTRINPMKTLSAESMLVPIPDHDHVH